MLNFQSLNAESLSEASELLRQIAGARGAGETMQGVIGRAARAVGFPYGRTKSIWYREARRIDAGEMDRLRARAAEIQRRRAIAAVQGLRLSLGEGADQRVVAALDSALGALGETPGAVEI